MSRIRRRRFRAATMGTVCDAAADVDGSVSLSFDRPLDVAPELGLHTDVATIAGLVAEMAGWLVAAGVGAGQRVAVCKRNHVDIVLWAFAISRVGAEPVLISAGVPASDAPTMLRRCRPDLLVTDRSTMGHGACAGWDVASIVPRIVCIDGPAAGTVDLGDLRGADPAPPRRADDGDGILITHTSGTTGTPKLVRFDTASGMGAARIEARAPILGLGADDRVVAAVSFVHARAIGGALNVFFNGPAFLGVSELVAPSPLDALSAFRPTAIEALPNTFLCWERFVGDDRHPFADVRLFHNTFDAIHPRTVRLLLGASRRRAPIWVQSWGQSESGGITAQIHTRRSARRGPDGQRFRKVGRTIPWVTAVRVVDPDTDEVLGAGRPGQLQVTNRLARGAASVAYVGQEDLHAKRRKGSWWTMGDVGFRSRSGVVHLLDREIDRIDGLPSSIELEDVLLDRLEEVNEVVVVAGPGGRPTAVVATFDGLPLSRDRWDRAIADLPLTGPPVQRSFDSIPRTATLKVRRQLLQDQLAAEGPMSTGMSGDDHDG